LDHFFHHSIQLHKWSKIPRPPLGKAFTDRLFGVRRRAVTRQRAFETLCSTLGIEHRLAPPRSPQTNGMVERFNSRIEDVLESLHLRSSQELGMTLNHYVRRYNQPLAQSALGRKTPLQAMKQRHKRKPKIV
jgi:transposase InsO family protein